MGQWVKFPAEVPVVDEHRSFLPEVSCLAISCNEYPGYKLIIATIEALWAHHRLHYKMDFM